MEVAQESLTLLKLCTWCQRHRTMVTSGLIRYLLAGVNGEDRVGIELTRSDKGENAECKLPLGEAASGD